MKMKLTKRTSQGKMTSTTPWGWFRIGVYSLVALWGVFFIQRWGTLAKNEQEVDVSNLTQLKFLMGMSYSSEEYQALYNYHRKLKNLQLKSY